MLREPFLGVDFAALRTLRLVYENRSFTTTATVLDVNQSAVSYTIEKLRRAFNDQLFYRQGGKVMPTDRCLVLVEGIARILDDFETLAEPVTFNPSTARQTITIACNYYERQIIIPDIIRRVRETAPGIRLRTINSTTSGALKLKKAEADLLVGPIRPGEDGFYCRSLLDEHYVCVMDAANPLCHGPLSVEDYISAPHAVINYGGGWRSNYLLELDRAGLTLNEALSVPSPAGIEDMILGTDLIATIPSRIAARYDDRLQVSDCPFPATFQIDLVWTTRTHHAPMHLWLRDMISDSVNRQVEADLSTA
ncbi:MAG: LysR family transcriptional regulator [Rhodospirillum sp.]|nr:LysR family transcriptional regulator [Rhodospirillum sp.]MCF8487922.1 LysR family transcriptional regulator [Rhodospirillum sp.]MCF8500677.1 LysR family transcriptional regulator [Rhodospirillum sp.]